MAWTCSVFQGRLTSSDREVGSNLGQGLVDCPDIPGVGVQLLPVGLLVIDTILLTTSYTDLCSN